MLGAQVGQVLGPRLAHVVVHAHRGGLVQPDVHALAGEPAADEVRDEIAGDLAEPLRAGQQHVLLAEAPCELPFGVLVQLCVLEQVGKFVGEVVVDQLELGDAVFVVQRDGRAVGDGVAEVVGVDVVAELLLGQLLPRDQRRSGEPHERGVGQRTTHVQGEGVVLATVRLVGDDDDVRAIREHRHRGLAGCLTELVDQREDVAVIAGEQRA